jgi:tRNA dimethylallyltransferase
VLARKPISEVHRTGRKPLEGWKVAKIGLMPPRDQLLERINRRIDSMLERGWLSEVQGLLKSGLKENAKPFDFIGYRELRAVIRGEIPLEQARELIQQATRRYAKRQLTWFRKETDIRWFSGFGDDADVQAGVFGWLKSQELQAGRQARERGV